MVSATKDPSFDPTGRNTLDDHYISPVKGVVGLISSFIASTSRKSYRLHILLVVSNHYKECCADFF